jgi:hypothetical protein
LENQDTSIRTKSESTAPGVNFKNFATFGVKISMHLTQKWRTNYGVLLPPGAKLWFNARLAGYMGF